MTTSRSIFEIAQEIHDNWRNPGYAEPYLSAMFHLRSISDRYFEDGARGIIAYFLSNATNWKGDVARRVKAELKELLQYAETHNIPW